MHEYLLACVRNHMRWGVGMGKVISQVTAHRDGQPPLQCVIEHDGSSQLSREEFALLLLGQAQERHTIVPDGMRGASNEQRLAEYGYTISSITHTLAE